MPGKMNLKMQEAFGDEFNLRDIRVVCVGNHSVLIENFKGIVKYTSEEIIVTDRQKRFKVLGDSLRLKYYTKFDVMITGNIKTFEWLPD